MRRGTCKCSTSRTSWRRRRTRSRSSRTQQRCHGPVSLGKWLQNNLQSYRLNGLRHNQPNLFPHRTAGPTIPNSYQGINSISENYFEDYFDPISLHAERDGPKGGNLHKAMTLANNGQENFFSFEESKVQPRSSVEDPSIPRSYEEVKSPLLMSQPRLKPLLSQETLESDQGVRDTRQSLFNLEDQMDIVPERVLLQICAHECEEKRTCLSVSEDGTKVVTGGADQAIRVWSVQTGLLLYEYTRVGSGVIRIKFASTSSLIAASTLDSLVKVYQAKSQTVR